MAHQPVNPEAMHPATDWSEVYRVVSTGEESDIYTINRDWSSGGETYVLDFTLHEAEEKRCIMKACIKIPCTETMDEWVERRAVVKDAGVTTPELYHRDRATIIEEFIPFSIQEAFDQADEDDRRAIAENVIATFRTLEASGFQPRPMHDLRSHGTDIVVVDFGEDLGPVYPESPKHGDQDTVLRAVLGKSALSL